MSRSKDIGTAAESDLVRYLRTVGWPHAERRALAGTLDKGDVTGTPGICWEVKARNRTIGDGQIAAWLIETELERANAAADFGVLVVKRRGHGRARVGSWWAVLEAADVASLVTRRSEDVLIPRDAAPFPVRLLLADVVTLLHAAGYGTPNGGEG